MLQGFEHVSDVDVKGSNQFIAKLKVGCYGYLAHYFFET